MAGNDHNHSLADIVYEQVAQDIFNGVYQPGDVLTELKLSEQMQMSRTPVREALLRLEQDSLVENQGKRSVVVGITTQDLIDILEIRLRLEGLVISRCCDRITEEELVSLDENVALQEFYASRNLPDRILEANSRFHKAIYAACGSRMLEKQLSSLLDQTTRFRIMSLTDTQRTSKSVAEHRAIFTAISQRDKAKAEELIIRHLKRARDSMLKQEH